MIDYKLKAEVLKTDCVRRVKRMDQANYNLCVNGIVPKFDIDDEFINLCFQFGGKYIKESRKINNASYRRVERLNERITTYLSKGQCIFLTLEFSPQTMQNTSAETRRKYVARYLKDVSDYYVANIDYGGKRGREHYHAVVVADWVDHKWEYGYMLRQLIHRTNSNILLSKYISKLTNHAIKETTKRQVYIYSRNK